MKKLIIAAGLALSMLGAGSAANAQLHVSVNLGSPVTSSNWYNTDDQYYYLPEQGVYYNVTRRVYVYPENGGWMYANSLPARYNGYNWRRSHYVVVRERSPFNYHNEYSGRFGHDYRGRHVEWRRNGMDHDRGRYGDHDRGRHDDHDRGRHDNHDRGNHNGERR